MEKNTLFSNSLIKSADLDLISKICTTDFVFSPSDCIPHIATLSPESFIATSLTYNFEKQY